MRSLKRSQIPWRGRLLLVFAAILGIALIAAACGDDEANDVPTEPLKIGFLNVFTGSLAEFGPTIQTGVELAIKHINAAGGAFGQDVVLVTADTQVDTTVAVEEARRLVDVEGVHAIIGPLASTISIAVAESVTGPAGIPTVSPSATASTVADAEDDDFLFQAALGNVPQASVLAQLATDEGYDNVAVLFQNDAYGQDLAKFFELFFDGTATSASFELGGQASYLAELQAAGAGGASVLVAIGFPTEAKIFIREAIENDLFSEFLFVDGTKSKELIDDIGADFLNGFKGTAPGGGPQGAAWDAAYLEEFGELPALPFVREAYDATIAIALAAELAGSNDGAAIRDALRTVTNPPGYLVIPGAEGIVAAFEAIRDGDSIDYDGAATSVDWDDDGVVGSGAIGIWQYQDGAIVEIEAVQFPLE